MRLYTSELVKKYKARTVVDHVSIDVNQGEIVGLLGPNGAGKTTTFYMIVGLIKPNEGRIFLESDEGQASELTDLPVYRRAQLGVGYLAQEASVFRRLSVEDNIRAVLEMTSFSKEYQNERVEALIEEFRLQKVRKSLGIQLSGGERRRTEIARAVAINPAFILLDEPFAGVDPIAVEDIQSIVATLKHKNIGVIITDHNVDETLAITDRAYLLYEGKVLKTGSPEELAAEVYAAYGDPFWILLAHRNDHFPGQYSLLGADLVLSGHGHGGIVRLPGIGAVFGTHMDLFPDYTAGLYEKDGTAMVVSRGLGGSRKLPLRIGNRPEVVTVVLRTEN